MSHRDWTVDPETGLSNSSPEFLRLAEEVARLITSNGGQAISRPWARVAARLILANLAHKHGMAPAAALAADVCHCCGKTATAPTCGPGCISHPADCPIPPDDPRHGRTPP